MGGFPNRPNRLAFGPTMINERPVVDPTRDLDAASVNLTAWQTAGTGRCAPKGLLTCTVAASLPTTVNQAFAFDPNGALALIVWVSIGVGHYRFLLAATYPDELGTAIATGLVAGIAQSTTAVPLIGSVELTSDHGGDVYFLSNAGAATDPASFAMLLW